MPLVAEGLCFAYPSFLPGEPAPRVLDGLDLRLEPGEWLAVMGASDAGKTTLCLLLAGMAPHLTGGTMAGQVVVAGRDTHEFPPPALADTVGLLFQEPEAQLFNPTVEAEVAWGLENLGLPLPDIRARIDEMLALFRLEPLRNRAPTDLSGGEKKRVALASVLAMRPQLLVLDEPLGGLDPVGRRQVLTALSELRRDRAVTIVMTESDPETVAAFADRLVVLHQGRIALDGPPRELFRQAARMTAWGVAVPQLTRLAAGLNRRLGTDLDFSSVEEARAALSPPLGEKTAARPARISAQPPCGTIRAARAGEIFVPGGDPGASVALQVSDLWFWYDDENAPALCGLDLSLPRGQFVAIVGANGSGKTTLVKHFNGLHRPKRGAVRVAGEDAAGRTVGELARQVGYLFQHPEQQIFSASVRQEVAFGPRNLGLAADEVEARVEAALARFDLSAAADRPPAILSYGLRRRVTLASLAAMDPPVLVLDEPSVGLDARGLAETFGWLAELHAQGRTILLVSHDMSLVAEHAERVVVLHRGQVLADGAPADLFRQPDLLARASLTLPPVVALAQALGIGGLTVDAFCDEYLSLLTQDRQSSEDGRS